MVAKKVKLERCELSRTPAKGRGWCRCRACGTRIRVTNQGLFPEHPAPRFRPPPHPTDLTPSGSRRKVG